ncbi:MAG TPA: class I SAM-dependent methyltransferase [Gaiellaceae bacterium]|nr:class I SAM-dependent methyltransferase [Gaiellaceae bacterium]
MPLVVDPDGVELATIRELADLRGARVLDVGCGDGRLSFACASEGSTVYGIDPVAEDIALARRATPRTLRGQVRFDVADAAEAELPEREFDLALFSWSL